jgi:tRNA(Arg) A34 adenosine deaminase TadA
MRSAIEEAEKAVKCDEIPVGCVFVRWHEGKYQKVCGSHNLTNLHKNASRHCEINCINEM